MNNELGFTLNLDRIDGAIFDMDGVVTDTARVHAAAWKQMFDEYLQKREESTGKTFQAFDIDADYRRHVDGKPRFDGVVSFLESRGISLPFGDPEDPPGKETVCGLGNLKNRYFLARVDGHGVEPYQSSVVFIRRLKEKGIRTAIISASRNAAQVLEAGGVTGLFDAKVDGVDADGLGIEGKPAPAIFLEAARRLGIEPANGAVFEDSLAGVEAGSRGGFGIVIGVDRAGQAEELKAKGADVTVTDLDQILTDGNPSTETIGPGGRSTGSLPSALDSRTEIARLLRGKRLAVFLDYDGTLTPIVDDPADATLSSQARQAVAKLAGQCTVALISGRDLADVQSLVRIDGIAYAGSHGFDIVGPDGAPRPGQNWLPYLQPLDSAEEQLQETLRSVPGVRIERKKFAIAVHYRRVAGERAQEVERAVDEVIEHERCLKKSGGKKIFEIRPNVDWDKGKALLELLEALAPGEDRTVPLFIGDDVTDEDAFQAIQSQGISVVVTDDERETAAKYSLKSPDEVRQFLETVAIWLEGAQS